MGITISIIAIVISLLSLGLSVRRILARRQPRPSTSDDSYSVQFAVGSEGYRRYGPGEHRESDLKYLWP